MKKIILLGVLTATMYACNNGGSNETSKPVPATDTNAVKASAPASDITSYDSSRGIGKFKHVDVGPGIDENMAMAGETIYGAKCAACHKLTSEKLVGPGWKGVTLRHTPEWIMNFITNTDEMLNTDARAKQLLEICLVRMPNQNLRDNQARQVLEFMRKNDAAK